MGLDATLARLHSKPEVTKVTEVTPLILQEKSGNPSGNPEVTEVTAAEPARREVTPVTPPQDSGLPTFPFRINEVTPVTPVTPQNDQVQRNRDIRCPDPEATTRWWIVQFADQGDLEVAFSADLTLHHVLKLYPRAVAAIPCDFADWCAGRRSIKHHTRSPA